MLPRREPLEASSLEPDLPALLCTLCQVEHAREAQRARHELAPQRADRGRVAGAPRPASQLHSHLYAGLSKAAALGAEHPRALLWSRGRRPVPRGTLRSSPALPAHAASAARWPLCVLSSAFHVKKKQLISLSTSFVLQVNDHTLVTAAADGRLMVWDLRQSSTPLKFTVPDGK